MQAFLDVRYCPPPPNEVIFTPAVVIHPTVTRRYYIAIEEVLWDYAPDVDVNAIP
jgi:hypothetical protein